MKFIVRNLRGADGNISRQVFYWCSGCGHAHSVPAERWHWNGSIESPTLSPSVRHYTVNPETKVETTICHYHLNGGVLEYCNDCQHELNGQKILLQEIPEGYGIPDDDGEASR
jgi:Family of unknown function (DUF6527)